MHRLLSISAADNPQRPLPKARIKGMNDVACADTDSLDCIAGDIIYCRLREKGDKFENTKRYNILVGGLQHKTKSVSKYWRPFH